MKNIFSRRGPRVALCALLLFLACAALRAQDGKISVKWNQVVTVSKTTPTLQVVVNPMLRSHSPIHQGSFQALKSLGADYVRYVPWFPYTRQAVAELHPPGKDRTYWDFTLMDSIMQDFMEATAGHSVVINFSTIPVWMFKTDTPVVFPDDPDEVFWNYNQGTRLRDTTMKELSDYFARLFSWYTRGGFSDELGKFHASGHHYTIPYWEVLNEPDLEHQITPRQYTKMYDAIVSGLKKMSPSTKFIGISLAFSNNPEWFEYFLNKKNHRPGIPLDAISYHFYASPVKGQTLDQYQFSFFDQASGFLNKVRYIESIRKRLSPQTKTTINEIGSIINAEPENIPIDYWNLSGALYAYLFVEMTKLGIDVAGESQLVGYPTQFPDVSMMDWRNGHPNPRYWVLKLLKDHFGPGDRLLETNVDGNGQDVSAQAIRTSAGQYLLLVNMRNREISLGLPDEAKNAALLSVDQSTGEGQPQHSTAPGTRVTLKPFTVMIVKL
ncbi:MAG TPA: hypothetical protein VK543_15740 [Puia sp.]|nr:hypothetical protein [Puia sp.]